MRSDNDSDDIGLTAHHWCDTSIAFGKCKKNLPFFQISRSTMDKLPIIDAPKHCAICIQTFQGEEAFEKHQSKLHRKGDIECEYCYKRFSRKEYLSRHIKTIHLAIKEDARCNICQRIFSDKERLARHDVFMHSAKTFQCNICEEKFSLKCKLETHKGRKHLRSRDFPCEKCPKKFFCKTDVRTHNIEVHSDYKPFKCDLCAAEFKRNSTWRHHRKSHLAAKNFSCPVCQKKFKYKASVNRCLELHGKLDPQKFVCPLENCAVTLTTKEGLRGHVKKHGERKRFQCEICTKSLSGKSELTRHIKNVHGDTERKFECSVCGLKCLTSSQLRSHMQTHSKQRFPCLFEGCQSVSNTQYGLNYHFKKKHGQINHRKSVKEIEEDKKTMLSCEVCGRKVKSGASPLHSMKLHMRTHKNQSTLDCPVQNCENKIFASSNSFGTKDVSYQLPVQYYNHIESKHGISFQEYEVRATFECKVCEVILILKSRKKPPKKGGPSNLATDFAPKWGDSLRKHTSEAHGETGKGGPWSIMWNAFFVRTKITLEKKVKVEPGFIDQLMAEKICKMDCNFDVRNHKFLSVYKNKLLKHYCTEHFGAELLKKELQYFKGKRFPQCINCDFEIRQSSNLNSKAVHIGVEHNEIIPILEEHFLKNTLGTGQNKN